MQDCLYYLFHALKLLSHFTHARHLAVFSNTPQLLILERLNQIYIAERGDS